MREPEICLWRETCCSDGECQEISEEVHTKDINVMDGEKAYESGKGHHRPANKNGANAEGSGSQKLGIIRSWNHASWVRQIASPADWRSYHSRELVFYRASVHNKHHLGKTIPHAASTYFGSGHLSRNRA